MGNRIAVGVIIAVLVSGGAYFANLSRESNRALRAMNETAASSGAALDQVRNEKKRLEDELKKRDAGTKKERAVLAQLRAALAVYEGDTLKLREKIASLDASAEEAGRKHAEQLSGLQAAAEKSQSLEDGFSKREAALLEEREAAARAHELELQALRVKMAEDASAAAAVSQKQAATVSSLSRILKNDGTILRREREAKENLEKKLKTREGAMADLENKLKRRGADLLKEQKAKNNLEEMLKEGDTALWAERKVSAHFRETAKRNESEIRMLRKRMVDKASADAKISQKRSGAISVLNRDLMMTKTSLSELDARHRAVKARTLEEGQRAAKLRESLEALKKQITGKELVLKETKDMLRIDIINSLLFDVGSAEVREKGRDALDKLVDFFKSQKGKIIRIEGHTDSQPITGALARRFPTNWELSAARAIAVVRYLQLKGVPPGLLSAAGYSFYKNEAGNETAEGRARNRRIVILLSRAKSIK